MPSKPAQWQQAVTWRLHRELVAEVKARAAAKGEPVVAFVVRALRRELDGPTPDR